jgi:2-iminoacetate synthase ThiH
LNLEGLKDEKHKKKERQDSSKEEEKGTIMKEKRENKNGAVFINYINFIITNIKFKICTYCKYVNISCGLKEMTLITIYGLTILINS